MIRRIEKAAVIGSGIMGGGIAALCASAGVPTLLLDIVPFDLKDEEKNKPEARNRIVKAGLDAQLKARPPAFMDKNIDVNLITTGNLEDDFAKLAECDIIFEVVVENLKIKQGLFEKIEKVMKPTAIIASNTSGLPLSKMAEGRSKQFKENFLIMHFFNPVRHMRLLEFVAGKGTKKEVLDFAANWGEKTLGKGIVWSNDTPNFIGNRIGVYATAVLFNNILDSGLTLAEVDAIFGAAMGRPNTGIFALADLVGLDTIHHLLVNSREMLVNDECRDGYTVPDWFQKIVDNKWLGNKSKQGFYKKQLTADFQKKKMVLNLRSLEYEETGKPSLKCLDAAKQAKTTGEKIKALLYGDDKGSKFAWKMSAAISIYAANRIPEIADSIVEIDNAMKWGYAWELGPFETWDVIGVRESVTKMEADGFNVPESIKKMLESGKETFYQVKNGKKQYLDLTSNTYKDVKLSDNIIFLANLKEDKKEVLSNESASLIDLGDGVFCLEYHTKMNSINEGIVTMIGRALDYVGKNGVGMVFGNQAPGIPGAFSAGGDLSAMLKVANEKRFSQIAEGLRELHRVFQGARYAPFPVVAAPYGMTLGGGCETCLWADKIVAHCETYIGQVEIGAGLVPAGGGCLNTWKKYIESFPRQVQLTDLGAFFIPVVLTLGQAKVSTSAAEARTLGFLGPKDRIIFNKDSLIGEAKKEVLRMVEDGYYPPVKTTIPVMGREGIGMVNTQLFSMSEGGFVPPHMNEIMKRITYIVAGGNVPQGTRVTEEHILALEIEAFVDLWKTEATRKMAEHILKTGKPLIM
ncbi:MAG: enoyl-CoA hydratase/isomerase family protein [Deltaproteobacteria bacterium]|nr:enoyl-CoA hydratase/isomerase family protein [Deltaproteobacteria bacterium]